MRVINRFLNSNRSIWIVLGAHFVIWLIVALLLDVHPDMADHWVWSRFFHWGYYEHPPMVALTMKLVALFGNHPVLGLKVGSVLFSTVLLFTVYQVGRLFFDLPSALMAVILLEGTPYYSLASVFWHIDQPYMLCWFLSLWTIGKYIRTRNDNWMLLLGVLLGLGGLSKYTMALFPVSLLVWCLLLQENRKLIFSWKTVLAALITIALIVPNLYWNYQNDWVTFRYNFEKGLESPEGSGNFLQFFISQFFLFSIVFSVYFWIGLVKFRKNKPIFTEDRQTMNLSLFLLTVTVVPMAFFTFASLKGSQSDPHWVNVAYVGAFLLLGKYMSARISEGRVKSQVAIVSAAYIINVLLVVFILSQVLLRILPISLPESISMKKMITWQETADQIEQIYRNKGMKIPDFVISREYQVSSALSLYINTHPIPHSIEKIIRNQWSPVAEVREKGAFLVCPPRECKSTVRDARERFGLPFKFIGESRTYRNQVLIRDYKIYNMAGSRESNP